MPLDAYLVEVRIRINVCADAQRYEGCISARFAKCAKSTEQSRYCELAASAAITAPLPPPPPLLLLLLHRR
jgi:hypothetical protein